jgi:hypothetical protein
MNLRLHGTPAECTAATQRLYRIPGLHIQDQSRPYPDRTGELVRVCLTVHLDCLASQAGEHAGNRGGRRR